MGKFFNHYMPDRAVGFAHPYTDRSAESWHYTLGYRGYDLDVERHVALWLVGIHPRRDGGQRGDEGLLRLAQSVRGAPAVIR